MSTLGLVEANGNAQRNPASVANSGHYVPPGVNLPLTRLSPSPVDTLVFYAEGIRPFYSSNEALTVYFYPRGPTAYTLKDLARATVVGVDLDVDSDNTNELNDPDGSDLEEALEDHKQHPGKALALNHLDRDRMGCRTMRMAMISGSEVGPKPETMRVMSLYQCS